MRLGTGDPALISAYAGHPATPKAAVAAEPAMKSRRRMRPLQGHVYRGKIAPFGAAMRAKKLLLSR